MLSCRKLVFVLLTTAWYNGAHAVSLMDTVAKQKIAEHKVDKISLLLYSRIISDSKGNIRIDENIVPNFKLNNWLRLELGLRQGERPQRFDSYYHYKVELQTKSFWEILRLIARMSDNVIKYPSPDYVKSNYLLIAESKWPLSKKIVALAAAGYTFSFQKNNSQESAPVINQGDKNNYPVFKFAFRYLLNEKGFIEAVYGSYDVFNPYLLTSPFMQISSEYELGKRFDLYLYYRYQYNNSVDVPLNDFLGIGVKLYLKN